MSCLTSYLDTKSGDIKSKQFHATNADNIGNITAQPSNVYITSEKYILINSLFNQQSLIENLFTQHGV